MTEKAVVQNNLLDSLMEAVKKLSFTILIYNDDTKQTINLQKGEIISAELPDSILPYVQDEKCYCNYFSRGDDMMVIYFIRFRYMKQKYVVILQDSKQRTRLNRLITALIQSLANKELSRGDIAAAGQKETISLLENQISDLRANLQAQADQFTKEIEKLAENSMLDKALWEHEKNDLNDQINRLQSESDVHQNRDLIKLWEDAAQEELNALRQSVLQMHNLETELEKARTDIAALQRELEQCKTKNYLLTQDITVLKAHENTLSLDDNTRAEAFISMQAKLHELETANSKLNAELQSFVNDAQSVTDREKQELEKLRKENESLEKECADLKEIHQSIGLKQQASENALIEKENELKQLQEELTSLTDKLEQHEKEYHLLQEKIQKKEKAIEELVQKNTEKSKSSNFLNETNLTLRKNRDQLSEMLNGISQPLFSISNEDRVAVANKALLAFCGTNKISDVAGHICYECVYKKGERCSWCMVEQVRQNEEPIQTSATINVDNTERNIDITFFPIFDADSTLVEVAEYITDKTELHEMNASLNKIKDKMKDFKKNRLDDMTQMNEIKTAYQEISSEHDRIVDRNVKMQKVIERLVSEDKAKELLAARTELVELRNKLIRSAEMIKNYKYQLDEQLIKYSNLNRRTFLQMERLLNIIKGKNQLKNDETTTLLTFLTREFEFVRKHFIDEQKRTESRTGENSTGSIFSQKSFKSVEEKLLKEKLSAKIPSAPEKDNG